MMAIDQVLSGKRRLRCRQARQGAESRNVGRSAESKPDMPAPFAGL